MYSVVLLFIFFVPKSAIAEDRFQLGPGKWLDNMTMSFECRPLEIRNRLMALIHEPVFSGNRLVFRECYEQKDPSGLVSGNLKEGWYWVDLNSAPEVKKLVL